MAAKVELEVAEGEKLPRAGEDLPEGVVVEGCSEDLATGEALLGLLSSAGNSGNAYLRVGRVWKQVTPGPLPLERLKGGKPTLDHVYIFIVLNPRGQSFPLYQASYTQVLQGYESSRLIKDTTGATWKHQLVKAHPELGRIATNFEADLSTLIEAAKRDKEVSPEKWVIKVCQKEPDESYESGGVFLEHLTLLVYQAAFQDVYRESVAGRGAFYRHNKKLKTSANTSVTSPDLAFCGLRLHCSDLGNADVYTYLRICWEFQVGTEKFPDGMGEVLDRSQRCRAGSDTQERVVFGAVTTGLAFRPMIVFARTDGGMVVRGPCDELGSLDTDTERGQPVCLVHIETLTFREILFQVYASLYYQLRFSMKAAAEPQSRVYRPTPEHRLYQPRPEKHILQCGDQEHEFQVLRAFIDGPFKGGTYLVRCGSLSEGLLVLKRGPCQAAQDLIVKMHGGMPVRTWNQVETELKIRRILGTSPSLKISELVTYGECKSPWSWSGCPALVTKFHGDSLEGRTLPIREVVSMGVVLIQTVVEMHRRGVYHTDISLKNITSCADKKWTDKFRLIDLGVAIHTLEEEPRSYILDLEFGSINSARQEELTAIADFESILYSMVKIAGMELPWSEAARKNDLPPLIGDLPPHGLFGILQGFVLGKSSLKELIYFIEKLEAPSFSESAEGIYKALTRKDLEKQVVGRGKRVQLSRSKADFRIWVKPY